MIAQSLPYELDQQDYIMLSTQNNNTIRLQGVGNSVFNTVLYIPIDHNTFYIHRKERKIDFKL